MRIAFLCKRRYMGKDVILDRYARLYEIPYQLARLDHDVRGWCLDYHGRDEGEWFHNAAPGSLRWQSRSLGRFKLPVSLSYPCSLLRQLRAFAPDVVIGASDIPHVVLARWLARRLGVPYAVDLYDNFEGFGQARLPGFVSALRRSVREANLVTTTSELLAGLVRGTYGARGVVIAMPSTVDLSVFRPQDKAECRAWLGLPADAKLVGTAGGLYADKGICTVYEAWRQLSASDPQLHLVLAGPCNQPPPKDSRVHYLGLLPHGKTAELFCALDLGVLYLRDTPFGRYCFPQKAYEMLACGLPVVAADVGAMKELFAAEPQRLYRADDAGQLADRIRAQLVSPSASYCPIMDWQQTVQSLEPHLRALCPSARA